MNTEWASAPSESIKDWPRITVVTPSYNQAAYLEETIQSVLLQAYPNLEYIIIDGGSKDGSVEIIKKYESWLTFWCSEPDNGQSNAINRGWRLGTGDILAWLNSDDVYKPGSLERIGAIFRENESLDLVYGDFNIIDETSGLKDVVNIREKGFADLLSGNCFGQPSTFVSREAVVRSGYLNENLHLCMDYDLWLKIASRGSIQYLPQVLASFRIHDKSKTSKQAIEMLAEQLEVANDFITNSFAGHNLLVMRVARFNLNAGTLFLESGLNQIARAYIRKGFDMIGVDFREEDVLTIASSLVRTYGRSALHEINTLFCKCPELANVEKKIESWIYALLSYDGQWGNKQALSDAFHALNRTPSKKMLLAVKSPVLRALIGRRLQGFIQLTMRR